MPSSKYSHKVARAIRFALLALSLIVASIPSYAADATDAALAFVKQRHLGNNLDSMAFTVASRTMTFATIKKQIGISDAQSLVREKLSGLEPKYQGQWDADLAASYAEFFSSDELLSLTDRGPASSVAAKFGALQSSVGRSMQSKSTGILQAFVSEALVDAFKQSTQHTDKPR
jgi:hypothetical protein